MLKKLFMLMFGLIIAPLVFIFSDAGLNDDQFYFSRLISSYYFLFFKIIMCIVNHYVYEKKMKKM